MGVAIGYDIAMNNMLDSNLNLHTQPKGFVYVTFPVEAIVTIEYENGFESWHTYNVNLDYLKEFRLEQFLRKRILKKDNSNEQKKYSPVIKYKKNNYQLGSISLKQKFQTIKSSIKEYEKYVFYVPEKIAIQAEDVEQGWYFWDETGVIGGGPYPNEKVCIERFDVYGEYLRNGII